MPESESDPWFVRAFDAGYLTRYVHRSQLEATSTVAWLAGAALIPTHAAVLDLCCGAGRHSVALAARGARVVGLDLSPDLLRHARAAAAAEPLRPAFVRGSMQTLPFRSGAFAGCLHMFTAFGYFERDDDNRDVLREVARVLAPRGRYVLDLFNGPLIVRQLVPESETKVGDDTVRERRWFDLQRKRLEKNIEIQTPSGRVERRFESVRVLDLAEITAWLADAGFTEVKAFGDYAGAAFDAATSGRMIVCASRGDDR